MLDWFLETGLYLLGVAVVPLLGLLLVCWGLWGDRSRGRPRCPKCWYDMRGSMPRVGWQKRASNVVKPLVLGAIRATMVLIAPARCLSKGLSGKVDHRFFGGT